MTAQRGRSRSAPAAPPPCHAPLGPRLCEIGSGAAPPFWISQPYHWPTVEGPAPHQVLVAVLGLQHVSQLAQVSPVSLFVGPRGEGGGQDPLRHVSEVQVPAALHKRVQAEAPRRGRRLRQARGWGSRWEPRARPRGFPGSVGPLPGGGCPGELLWGTLRRAEMGDHPGALTYLGRVLRCFEWFRDLVDPWWMRGDGA